MGGYKPETEQRGKNLAFKRTATKASLKVQGAGINQKSFQEVVFWVYELQPFFTSFSYV